MTQIDWNNLGCALRESSIDAHGEAINIEAAYSFLICNPECFGVEEWPSDMPQSPNAEIITAYYAGDVATLTVEHPGGKLITETVLPLAHALLVTACFRDGLVWHVTNAKGNGIPEVAK